MMDHTIWYKTVIVGFRLRQVIEPNIPVYSNSHFEFKKDLNYYHYPHKFKKSEYFKDFKLKYEEMGDKQTNLKLNGELMKFLDLHYGLVEEGVVDAVRDVEQAAQAEP